MTTVKNFGISVHSITEYSFSDHSFDTVLLNLDNFILNSRHIHDMNMIIYFF
jgi:hypothetical protein